MTTGNRARGRFPVLITQTPYGTPRDLGDYFVKRGYIFVTAYARGTNGSGGTLGAFDERAAKDGAEVVRWAATQLSGSNGRVGLTGGSYAGINQLLTVAQLGRGSPVQAIAPYCMGVEIYRGAFFSGGIPTQSVGFQVRDSNTRAAAKSGQSANILSGGPRAYDGSWRDGTPGNYAQRVVDTGVPVLLWSSDRDIYAQSSLELYAMLQNAARKAPMFAPMTPNRFASARYQILISQGGHCAGQDQRITLQWFDTWLKDTKTGLNKTALSAARSRTDFRSLDQHHGVSCDASLHAAAYRPFGFDARTRLRDGR